MRASGDSLQQFRRRQDGSAMLMVLAFMALTVPLLMAALGLANALVADSQVKKQLLKRQYAAFSVGEYVEYLADDPIAWKEVMDGGGEDTVAINGEAITFTVTGSDPPPTDHPSLDFQPLQTTKSVAPATAPHNELTIYTYTITVTNVGDGPEELRQIYDGLGQDFTYVTGSTSGVTTTDPAIDTVGQGWESGDTTYNLLGWAITPSVTIPAGEAATLQFQATAKLATGNYCNEAWVEPGEDATSSGPTAKIVVGSPSTDQCSTEAMQLVTAVDVLTAASGANTRYTITIIIINNSSETYNIKKIQDLLPENFSYVNNSTSGTITGLNPATANVTIDGVQRQRLTWQFSSPPWELPPVNPGETKTLSFQADATLSTGNYWHEARVQFHQDTAYSWPSNKIRILDTYDVSATDAAGNKVGSFQVWLSSDKRLVNRWEIH